MIAGKPIKRIRARDLQPGDITTGSNQKVISISTLGKRIFLTLETESGAIRRASWHGSTTLGVHRDV